MCLPQETYQSFVSQSSPELTAPALESGDERARLPTKGGCNEKIVPDPLPVVGRHASWQQRFIGAIQTRREYLFL